MARGVVLGQEQVSLDPRLHVEPGCRSSGEPCGPAPSRQSPVPPTQSGPRWGRPAGPAQPRTRPPSPRGGRPLSPRPVGLRGASRVKGSPRAEPRLLPSLEKRLGWRRSRPPVPGRCPLPRAPSPRTPARERDPGAPRGLPSPCGCAWTVRCGAAWREHEAEGGAEKHPHGWRGGGGPPQTPAPASLPRCGPTAARRLRWAVSLSGSFS